jgi:sterol desaturase/sphingolipid hydroxylase (fatty acid hydroxylase superfamily)
MSMDELQRSAASADGNRMASTWTGQRNAWGDWRPEAPITLPPIASWPPRPVATLKWLFGFPGYLWPMNSLWLAISLVTWFFLTPALESMRFFEPWWIGILLARNYALVLLIAGGLHLYLYVLKGQGETRKFTNKPLTTGSKRSLFGKRFFFGDQVRDNMLRTLGVGVPVVTAYEAVSYWLFSNGHIGFMGAALSPTWFWAWFAILIFIAPVIHAVHFYCVHRLLHTKLLYRKFHCVHHLNVEVGPWSGLAMHPLEQLLYFSTVVVQWLLALHPVNTLFQIHIALFPSFFGHSGFEKVMVGRRFGLDAGNYFHYLHHKYFECNYGGSLAPLDVLFGTFHDGSDTAQAAMRERMQARRGADA